MKEIKTIKELIGYLKQFPENTKVVKHGWDSYNDEPAEFKIFPIEKKTKNGKLKKIQL